MHHSEDEHTARHTSHALEAQGRLPAGFTDHNYPLTKAEQHELRRLKAALAASPNPDVFCALTRGEPVPLSSLDPRVTNYHTRRTAAA